MPPKEQLNKGYEGFNVPDNFSFPSCGIEDVDRALFELFDRRLAFEVKVNEQTTKVPVVFAAGERFALTRRQKPIRDKNNALILPLIAIKRTSIGYKTEAEAGGVAISFRQNTDYVIRKRLDSTDRNYQNIVNKLSIKNQDNVTSRGHFLNTDVSPGRDTIPGTKTSRRNGPGIAFGSGRLNFPLNNEIGNNIMEVITIPYPIFVQLNYEVTFWTQYMSQMNQLLETMLAKTDGQGREFQIVSNKGFKFTAFLMGTLNSGDNFENYTGTERVIKYSFSIRVPSYILSPKHPGISTPYRTFHTAPDIVFDDYEIRQQVSEPPRDPHAAARVNAFILSDVETLTQEGVEKSNRSQETLETVVKEGGKKKYESLVTRKPRSGEKIDSGRILTQLEETKD
jgi:hypothetical protein